MRVSKHPSPAMSNNYLAASVKINKSEEQEAGEDENYDRYIMNPKVTRYQYIVHS